MSQFNEGLSTFLVECREGALEELKSDTRYANLKTKQANLWTIVNKVDTKNNIIFPNTQNIPSPFH